MQIGKTLWNDRQRGPSKGLIYIKFNTVRSSQSDDSERIKLEKQPKYITITIKKQKQLTTLLRVIGDYRVSFQSTAALDEFTTNTNSAM